LQAVRFPSPSDKRTKEKVHEESEEGYEEGPEKDDEVIRSVRKSFLVRRFDPVEAPFFVELTD
jgi:hypothetical protein